MSNIVLIGLMGAGKTTVGKRLAKNLGWEFIDTDQLVENRCGTSISVIFEVEGEEGFRKREHKIIKEIMQNKRQVISSGGGAPIELKNRQLLKKGFVVYLFVKPISIWKRLKTDDSRPILNASKNLRKKIEELYYQRDPIYREVADYIAVGGNIPIKKLVFDLQKVINDQGKHKIKVG